MSNAKETAIKNATEVIERFGGIRPMAKKINVAVTTVQGWKKRNVIPATRRALILEAAATYDVDLSDIIRNAPQDSNPANENAAVPPVKPKPSAQNVGASSGQVERPVPQVSAFEKQEKKTDLSGDIYEEIKQTERNAVKKSVAISVFIIVLTLAVIMVLFSPFGEKDIGKLEQDVNELYGEMDAVKTEQSFLSTLIPDDLDERIAALQQHAEQARREMNAVLDKAERVSQDVLSEGAGTLEQRLSKLEQHMAGIAGSSQMVGFFDRLQQLGGSLEGQEQLGKAASDLNALVTGLQVQSGEQLEDVLLSAREQSDALNQTFENVPAQDLKAAALLLGMSQLRQSLNRDNAVFDEDLQLLMNLVGSENTELTDSLERMAPYSQSGVLTPEGLTDEFKTLAGEAVVASLKGEDVSFQDKAKARFNELFQVEKEGELITGTPTQASVTKAEKLLEEGDIAGAIAEVETLQGPAAGITAGWLEQARATLQAQEVKQFLGQGIKTITRGVSSGVQLPGSKTDIFLKPSPNLPIGNTNGFD